MKIDSLARAFAVAALVVLSTPAHAETAAASVPELGAAGCDFPTVRPAWISRPAEAEVRKAYPIGAPAKGSTEMQCDIGSDGGMRDCSVLSESPPGAGFGAASLKLSALFKMTPPRCADGRAARGGTITIPMQWKFW